MKKIFGYIYSYWLETDKIVFLTAAFITAFFVFINYYFGLNHYINSLDNFNSFVGWYLVFLFAFSIGYALVTALGNKRNITTGFLILLFLAPAIFAWKMAFEVDWNISRDEIQNAYWNRVIYWPFKLVIVTLLLWLIWKLSKENQPFYGLKAKGFSFRPYLIMLIIMIPLIALASTQPDFLHTYPKLKNISFLNASPSTGVYKLLYELSYGSDFFTIELFFRGFLVLAFAKWFGKDAILPMAMFYCTIHFGKPLGECISSFFGGMILGLVTYHTRTIYGGLIVHLGIAWMMELGGYWGNMLL